MAPPWKHNLNATFLVPLLNQTIIIPHINNDNSPWLPRAYFQNNGQSEALKEDRSYHSSSQTLQCLLISFHIKARILTMAYKAPPYLFPLRSDLTSCSPLTHLLSDLLHTHRACSHLKAFPFSLPFAQRYFLQTSTELTPSYPPEFYTNVTFSERPFQATFSKLQPSSTPTPNIPYYPSCLFISISLIKMPYILLIYSVYHLSLPLECKFLSPLEDASVFHTEMVGSFSFPLHLHWTISLGP